MWTPTPAEKRLRFLTRIRRPRTGKRGISAGQRRESAERRVPLGGSLFRRAALEVPDDSLQAWPAAGLEREPAGAPGGPPPAPNRHGGPPGPRPPPPVRKTGPRAARRPPP